jgi:hypothetical protein
MFALASSSLHQHQCWRYSAEDRHYRRAGCASPQQCRRRSRDGCYTFANVEGSHCGISCARRGARSLRNQSSASAWRSGLCCNHQHIMFLMLPVIVGWASVAVRTLGRLRRPEIHALASRTTWHDCGAVGPSGAAGSASAGRFVNAGAGSVMIPWRNQPSPRSRASLSDYWLSTIARQRAASGQKNTRASPSGADVLLCRDQASRAAGASQPARNLHVLPGHPQHWQRVRTSTRHAQSGAAYQTASV